MSKIRTLYKPDLSKNIPLDNTYGQGKGRMYGNWAEYILGSARSNGHSIGDLIEEPSGIIESILRDEVFTERDLRIASKLSTAIFTCDNALYKEDGYYQYAEVINATTNAKSWVADYLGQEFTLADADALMADNDNIILSNIQGDYKIDYASFDAIGNTTNGKRKNWKFAKSLNSRNPVNSIIDELLYNSHCIMFESADEDSGFSKLKIKALDKITGAPEFGTWTKPVTKNESGKIPQCSWELMPIENIYTSFKLFYAYDYGRGDYQKSILVDKNGYSNPSGGSTLTDEHLNLCKFAEKTYRVSRPLVYSSNWIYDDATAEYFLDKKIRWHTEQRLKIKWYSPFYSATQGGIQNEIGDQGFISYADGIPAGYEYKGTTAASHKFMISNKRIITNPEGVPYLYFGLIDLGI